MDLETTTIKRQQSQRITLEIDVIGDEVDFAQCEKIADSFKDFIKQVWCLADPRFHFTCNSKVEVQLPKQKTHQEVQLPSTKSSAWVKQPCEMQLIHQQAKTKK